MARKSLFYRIYFVFIGVFLVLLAAALGLLYVWLGAYESSRPEAAIETLYSDYIKKGNLYAIKEKCGLEVSPYETEDSLNSAFMSLIDGKDLALQADVGNRTGKTRVYIVTAGDEPLLSVKLQQKKNDGRFGFKSYAVVEAVLAENHFHSITVTAPSDADILINGIALKKESSTQQAIPEALQQKADGDELVTPQTYTLEHFLSSAPNITPKEPERFKITEKDGVYTVQQILNDNTKKQIQDFALAAAQSYAAYMQNDVPLHEVAEYMDTKTTFYKNVQSSMVIFAWKHNGYTFEDNHCGEIYAYSDTLYRCRISFTQVLYLGKKTYSDRFDKFVYLCKTAEGWKVIDMQQFTEN